MSDNKQVRPISYAEAGVDIAAGEALVEQIRPLVAQTHRAGVIGSIGGFGGLFELPRGYREPVLVSGTDGVGTKLRLAIDALGMQDHVASPTQAEAGIDTVGIDLVAMCVNDILVCGAEPLWFLDYFATGKLDVPLAARVVAGVACGCKLAGAALLGGETAEMPGMYHGRDFDLAGFATGIVEKSRLIDGRDIVAGDAIIGLPASGPHSNGFSLIRRLLEHQDPLQRLDDGEPLLAALLAPTRIYVKPLLALLERVDVKGIAHITGGGLVGNLPRVLPSGTTARIDTASWSEPPVMHWLRYRSGLGQREFLTTFNGGIGMSVIVAADKLDAALQVLEQAGEHPQRIGEIRSTEGTSSVEFGRLVR